MANELKGNTNEQRYFDGVFSYVDENGEARISAPASTHRVVSYEQTKAFKEAQERYRRRKGDQRVFTASNMRTIHEVYGVLTTAQCGYLMLLQCYVNFNGGVLVKGADKTPMSKRVMREVLQLSEKPRTFYDFYKACIQHGIIIENEDGTFAVNERYHFKGAFNDTQVVKMYSAKIKRIYSAVKAADIGLIYRMLPYVHYGTNTLCDNPFEQQPEFVRPFNRKSLSEAIGVDPQVISRRLPKMVFDGEYVIAQVKVGGKTSYMFNPWVFYRKEDEPDATLRRIFNVKPNA